jgi:hypothetical protein
VAGLKGRVRLATVPEGSEPAAADKVKPMAAGAAKDRPEPGGGVIVAYLVVSGMVAFLAAMFLSDRWPRYPAVNGFFGSFWLLFAGSWLSKLVTRLRARRGARSE